MLIYRNKLHFFVEFCLVLTALMTFLNNLLMAFQNCQFNKKQGSGRVALNNSNPLPLLFLRFEVTLLMASQKVRIRRQRKKLHQVL